MGLRQVLVVGAFAFHQVGHGIEPQAIDTEIKPVAQHGKHFFQHPRIVKIQVRLM